MSRSIAHPLECLADSVPHQWALSEVNPFNHHFICLMCKRSVLNYLSTSTCTFENVFMVLSVT